MQKRKSFFNNEMEQRFSLRKYTIGLCSVCLGFVVIGMGSQTVKADTVNDVEKSSAVQENKAQDTDSANTDALAESKTNTSDSVVAKSNTTPTETKENEAGSVAATAPKTADSNNSASVNTLDQSKSENSSAVAPTSEKTQLQTSQDSSIKVKENNLNTNKSDTPKTVVQPTSLNDENNLRDPDSKDVEVKPKESSNVDTNEQKETSTALPKQPANADTQLAATTSGVQPFVNLAVESDNNDLTPKHETIDSQWTIHYVNQADHKQELKDPTVITMQYTRTNTPQSDGKIQYGDWSYVPDSFKQTGTPITVKDSNNPVKQDNVDKNGENFDVFTITAMYPTVTGYDFYNGINGTRLHDNLRNNERQADAMSKDFYAEYDVAKPTQETVGSQWRIHYIDSTNHEHELKAPTVINLQYARTNTPQSDGTIQHGDWSYVPGSFKQTGTQITVNDSDNPVKEDNVDKDGKNEDVFIIDAVYPSITGYNFHDGINNARLHDYLLNYDPNGNIQMPTMGRDFYVEYDPIGERSVAVKFVDDQSYDFNTSDHKKQVGQAITLTGRDGDTVDLNLTIPDKYQLADGQQLPTTYTFAKGSGDLKIHLVHQVVQREATIDVQLGLMAFVDFGNNSYEPLVVTQAQWAQLKEEKAKNGPVSPDGLNPFTEVGTLTGHVGYDLVDEEVVSFGDDWTSLNLGGQTYQMPNGTEVVNGILVDSDDTIGKKLKEYYLNEYQNWDSNKHVDPDYVNRPWHGYLSVNATNSTQTPGSENVIRLGLQAGLAGNEPNILAKATGDRAATAVEMANKTIDVNWLSDNLNFGAYGFSEKDGRLQAETGWEAFGGYIPYVEKTATRTINVTTPDGKTTAVKQTATLAKQVDFGKDAHPTWTTGEWANYDVPTIPGYTASQSNVNKETVTGETKDQTVNITYTANPQTTTVVYQTEDGTSVHTTTVNGKTGQTVTVPNEVPTGWHVVNGTVPSEITFGPNGTPQTVVTIAHSHVTVTPDAPKTTSDKLPDNPGKTYPAGIDESDLNKTVTRTIKVTTPDGQTKTVVKAAHLTRTADVDEVTGEVTYSDWTTGYWSDYTAPSVPGYTANYPYIAGQLVTGETTDQTIEITYTANNGTQTIVYQDKDGSEVGKQVVPGKTDETVKVTPEIPDGYVVKGEIPTEVTIKPDDTPITVTVEHGKSHVTPDKPVNKGDLIPDTKDKHYPEGLTHNDLNKTVTREITIIDPTGKKSTTTQTVTFTRGATVDEVTNEVTYDDWSENGKHTFDKVDVPNVPGYTASGEVPSIAVTPETQSSKVNITYTANDGTQTIVYQDEDGSEVGKQVVPGKTDETVKVTPEIPDGYVVKGEIPTEVTIKPDDTPITVTVEHGKSHVTPDKPVNKGDLIPDTKDKHYPEGLTHNDLNKTVTREITIIDPTGKKSTTTQTVTFTRGATVDEVTNEVTYDDWSENGKHTFDKVDVPNVPGYTASGEVPSIAVTPETQSSKVDITYTANTQAATITYIDDTTKTNLDSKEANGKFGQAITFGTAPTDEITNYEKQGYKLVSNNFKPGIKYQNDNKFNIFEVHLVHTYEPVETSQTITETIHYIDVNGKPVAPDYVAKAVIEMTGTRDKVTNSITWNTPSTGHFDEVISPEVPNMTPDKKFIPSRNVQYGDSDITENVVYTSDETSREPEKPNDQGKPNSKTPEKPNKSGNPTSKTSEKSNKSSKEVSKQFGTIAKTTIPEKPIDSRTVDNHVSAKTTTKRELPQTGTTANTGIWTGLVSIITSLGLLGASKKRKKN